MQNPQPNFRKPLGGVLVIIGIILLILAYVRLNSLESQLVRAFGGSDSQSTAMLVIGIPLIIAGIWMFLSSNQPKLP